MARRSSPTKLKILKGEKNKDRINQREPVAPSGSPVCPEWFDAESRAIWDRLVSSLESMGIVSAVDGESLAIAVQCYQRWSKASRDVAKRGFAITTASGKIVTNPSVGVCERAETQWRQYAQCFGLTPSGRASIHVDKDRQKNVSKLAKFLA
jgi:P27 family predicted phage terminase small subunit